MNWPSDLPNPLREGLTLTEPETFERTEFDGSAAYRKKAYIELPRYKGTLYLKAEQVVRFHRFYASEINNGLSWFKMEIGTNFGFYDVDAHFIRRPSVFSLSGTGKRVDFEIEFKDGLTAEWIEFIYANPLATETIPQITSIVNTQYAEATWQR